jgi:AcrR family transcriptional regulator
MRIAEAAMELHGTIGPARTTVTAVAERAGVQRHTVYRHFPTDHDLFSACSGLWAERYPWPDVARWREIGDPGARLRAGLGELYAWYEQAEPMLVNVLRDVALVPAAADQNAPFQKYVADAARALVEGRPRRKPVIAAARHVVDFHTWRSLARDGGLSRAQAVGLAAAMVEAASTGAADPRTRAAAAGLGAAASRTRAASRRG